MYSVDSSGVTVSIVGLLLKLRLFSIFFVIIGALVLLPVVTVGIARLRKASNGPLGEVCLGLGLVIQAVAGLAWWGPALLR